MIERVLAILNLCLIAKEMGHNVFFRYAPHVQEISVHAYDGKYQYETDEEADFIFNYYCYLDGTENQTLDDMETSIQKLINGEFE